MEKKEECYPT